MCLDSTVGGTLFRGQLLFRLLRFYLLGNSIRPATVDLRPVGRSDSYGSSLSLSLGESGSSCLLHLVKQGTHNRRSR